MYVLIFLLAFCIFVFGVLMGVRCQEINLRCRERRLAEERRRVNAQIRALEAHHEVNNLIWQARNELRQDALVKAQDMPFVIPQTRIRESGPVSRACRIRADPSTRPVGFPSTADHSASSSAQPRLSPAAGDSAWAARGAELLQQAVGDPS